MRIALTANGIPFAALAEEKETDEKLSAIAEELNLVAEQEVEQ